MPDDLSFRIQLRYFLPFVLYYLALIVSILLIDQFLKWYGRKRVKEFWESKKNLYTDRKTVGGIANENIVMQMLPKGILKYLSDPEVRIFHHFAHYSLQFIFMLFVRLKQ